MPPQVPPQSPSHTHTPAPNTQSDTQWLQQMGYPNGLLEFMDDYGFTRDEQDDALILFHQFRDEQQELWEMAHQKSMSETRTETRNYMSFARSRTVISVGQMISDRRTGNDDARERKRS